jgi:5'-methylthioadenosine phosphorylase
MRIGLILGTGMDSLADQTEWSEVRTPYGLANISTSRIGGQEITLLRRHGPLLNVPPHLINYQANMWALRDAGVKCVIATAAVGSLRKDIFPGSMAVIEDFIDFTKHRVFTTFDTAGKEVVHIDFTTPYDPEISRELEESALISNKPLGRRVVLVCVDGPRYETPAEVKMFANWGGDVVGMTGVPEVTLARELGMRYAALAIVTNLAAGISEHPLSHQEVLETVTQCRDNVREIIQNTLPRMHAASE